MKLAPILLSFTAVALLPDVARPAVPEGPNVVVILSDDYGWGSATCYGADPSLIRTPNIDRLATEGRRFTDANTTSGNSGGAVSTSLTLRAGWSAADNILIDSGIGVYHYDYNDDGNRKDKFYVFDIGARYYMNEYLYTALRYWHERRDSSGSSLDYRDNRIMLTLGGQL